MSRLETLKQYLENEPDDSFLLFAIAKEHEKTGNEAEALSLYLKILENEPSYIGLYYHLGKLYERIQDNLKAKESYVNGIEIAKKQKDFHAASELNGALENMVD